ncbi:hypothetical protein NLG97_g9743 [Lecanicillium saksenae]|uniref:Uncharacterized protein n=1 Tax=Lecanicillium saksenae TaxID=468837 RepID=A0ACC1QJ42_9HYPO|nr:hypothetical protein NLG97_g9743 [Lecanicillium saksenae]
MPSFLESEPIAGDPTLHLPRIVCLHGGGTNARIFRAQCRVLRAQLQPYFRLVFPEAPFHSEAGPDVVSVFSTWGPFKSWIRGDSLAHAATQTSVAEYASTIHDSIDAALQADDYSGATGPVAGLLGFSQGAKMAGSLLLREQDRLETEMFAGYEELFPEYRFAVLLAGRAPLVKFDEDIQEWCRPPTLRLPTLHVHGLQDKGLHMHRDLLRLHCTSNSTRLIEWDGYHRVPIKTKDVSRLVREILDMAEETGVFLDQQ